MGYTYKIFQQDGYRPYIWRVEAPKEKGCSGACYNEIDAENAARERIDSLPPAYEEEFVEQDGPTIDELYKGTDMELWDMMLHESGKLAGITRERPHFDSSGKEGVFEDGVRWCETSLWYRQWDDGEMLSSPEDWGEDVTLCDDGSGTLAVIYAEDQIAYFEGSDYMYPQGDAIDFSKALGDDELAREVLIESSRYDENVSGEAVDVAKFEERWIIPDVQPKDYR